MSSLSNFALNIYVARMLGAEQYGIFSVVFVTYAFALNASRGLVADPLMVRFSHVDRPTWRRVVASCTGTAISVGLVLGAVVLVAAAFLGGTLGLGFLALALALPGLLLQDTWRFAFFSLGADLQAFLNDMIWLAVLIPALVGLQWAGMTNVFWSVLAWGELRRSRPRWGFPGRCDASRVADPAMVVAAPGSRVPLHGGRDDEQRLQPAAHLRHRSPIGSGRGRLCPGSHIP